NEYDATGDGHGDCRRADHGYYLIANGQPAFEATIGYRNPRFTWPGRFVLAAGVGNYLAAIAVVGSTALSLPLFVLNAWSTPGAHLVLLALLGLIPSLDVAIALVNRAVMRAFGATTLPGLALHDGIPSHLRTMVVVPALLTTRAALEAQIARLEIHYLASPVGKLAHPLNHPRFDAATGQVVEGYAVLQPRVAPSLPVGREGSLFQRVFSSASGIDPYASAVSDVYQDLFGEGSYAGKGIYHID